MVAFPELLERLQAFFSEGLKVQSSVEPQALAPRSHWRWLGAEMSSRLLGPREQQRIGYVYALAASEISERIKRGAEVRQDGFFGLDDRGPSDATEVWESVLMKSQREPEEAKLPYMGAFPVKHSI